MPLSGCDRLEISARPGSAPTGSWCRRRLRGPHQAARPDRGRHEGRRRVRAGAVLGPLIDMKAVEKVDAHIADAVQKGAKVVTGGKRSALGGTFFEPTALTDVTTHMVITKEESFGPVAPLYRFKTDDVSAVPVAMSSAGSRRAR